MNRKWTLAVCILMVVTLVGIGCAKKPPAPPEAPMEEPPAPEPVTKEIEPPPAPPEDPQPEWMSYDMEQYNKYLREKGLIGDVYFDFDQYDLKPDARDRLAKNAAFLRDNPEVTVNIEGHCDERGTNDYNIALGDRRANAAQSYLVSLGIDASRLRLISYGEEQPVCTESGESCWSRNRRAKFVITGRS